LTDLTVSLGGVWQKAEQTNGGAGDFVGAFYVPNLKWRVGVTKSNILGRLTAGAGLTYTSDRYLVMYGGLPKTIDRVYEFDASLSARVTHLISLSLSGFDLTDQKRPDQIGYSLGDHDFPSPGRRFSLQARLAAF
jgi:outer membrane receptor protein involved in Fe transport